MLLGNGIRKQTTIGKVQMKTLSWRYTFENNLPYDPRDMLVFNMPPQDEETPVSTPDGGSRLT